MEVFDDAVVGREGRCGHKKARTGRARFVVCELADCYLNMNIKIPGITNRNNIHEIAGLLSPNSRKGPFFDRNAHKPIAKYTKSHHIGLSAESLKSLSVLIYLSA